MEAKGERPLGKHRLGRDKIGCSPKIPDLCAPRLWCRVEWDGGSLRGRVGRAQVLQTLDWQREQQGWGAKPTDVHWASVSAPRKDSALLAAPTDAKEATKINEDPVNEESKR